jgi:hypothetical protein
MCWVLGPPAGTGGPPEHRPGRSRACRSPASETQNSPRVPSRAALGAIGSGGTWGFRAVTDGPPQTGGGLWRRIFVKKILKRLFSKRLVLGERSPLGRAAALLARYPPSHYLKPGPAVRCRWSPEFPFASLYLGPRLVNVVSLRKRPSGTAQPRCLLRCIVVVVPAFLLCLSAWGPSIPSPLDSRISQRVDHLRGWHFIVHNPTHEHEQQPD